jgi:small conductance mechanosensitive channel
MWEAAFISVRSRASEVWDLFGSWAADHLLQIIIIVVAAEIVYRLSTKAVSKLVHKATHRPDLFPTALDRKKRLKTIDSLVNAALRIAVFVIAGIMIISELGINTGPLIASAGVIGVALGFGAQSLIKDFMSGFFVITENQLSGWRRCSANHSTRRSTS